MNQCFLLCFNSHQIQTATNTLARETTAILKQMSALCGDSSAQSVGICTVLPEQQCHLKLSQNMVVQGIAQRIFFKLTINTNKQDLAVLHQDTVHVYIKTSTFLYLWWHRKWETCWSIPKDSFLIVVKIRVAYLSNPSCC